MESARSDPVYRHPEVPQHAAVFQSMASIPIDPRLGTVASADVVPKPVLNSKQIGLDENKEEETPYHYFSPDGQETAL